MERWIAVVGCAFALLAVGLGAFGAHALEERLPPRDLEIFEVGVRYQMYHALALIGLAALLGRWPGTLGIWAGVAFAFGIVVFSGSLYLLVGTGARWWGAITPIGGTAFLVGWVLAIIHLLRAP